MHINEGKDKLALFYTANNVLLTPLLSTILLFSFLNFLFPFFPPPPPPHFYCFPSSSSSSFLLFSLLLLLLLLLIFIVFPVVKFRRAYILERSLFLTTKARSARYYRETNSDPNQILMARVKIP